MNDAHPSESSNEHTHILRVMLATEDCIAFWNAPSDGLSGPERARIAFEGHWFGSKSEPRVKTLLSDMSLRFDAFPGALAAIRSWKPERELAPWICHFHTQLADPIYRRFTGEFLPARLARSYTRVDRESVARWVQEQWPGRWSPSTCIKFGSNLLATAFEAGLLKDRKDPRKLGVPRLPRLAIEYLFYLLREVETEGELLNTAYIRSIAPTKESRSDAFRSLQGLRITTIAEFQQFEWSYPSLMSWAQAQRQELTQTGDDAPGATA